MVYRDGTGRYANVEFLLRSLTTMVLALGVTAGSLYEVIFQHVYNSPVVNWGGIIVGVFFGAQVAKSGEDRARSSDREAS